MKNLLTAIILTLFCTTFLANAQDLDRVQGGKTITIAAKGIPADEIGVISGPVVVDKSSGTIKMPYLDNPIYVVGKTGRQVEDLLVSAYKQAGIFTTPVFVVTVSTDAAAVDTTFVQVGGNVAARRNVPYRQGLTLLAAIIDAGDLTEFGSRKVQVTRKGRTETYDYYSIKDRNMPLLPGDQIYVPNRGAFEGRPGKLVN